MPAFDPNLIRPQFPSLAVEQDGVPVAYLDGPGGTQVPQRVIDAVSGYYCEMNANHGGAYLTSRRSDAMAEAAHEALADFLGAGSPAEVKIGENMTTLTFRLSRSLSQTWEPGDEVVVTRLDHDANVTPWVLAARDRGVTVRTIELNEADVTLDPASIEASITPRTKLVAVGYASNATGTINPVKEIVARAHAVGALTYVDAVHYAPHGPIDVRALDTDFLVCSTYKFFGPHLGVLYGRSSLLDTLPAYKVRPSEDRWETGTSNFEGIAGALATVDYIAELVRTFGPAAAGAEALAATGASQRRCEVVAAMHTIESYERGLSARFLAGCAAIDGVRVWGITDPSRLESRTPTFGLRVAGLHPRATCEALGERGIFTWDGDFYATNPVEQLGLTASGGLVRIGFAHYTTVAEVDRALTALAELAAATRTASAAG